MSASLLKPDVDSEEWSDEELAAMSPPARAVAEFRMLLAGGFCFDVEDALLQAAELAHHLALVIEGRCTGQLTL